MRAALLAGAAGCALLLAGCSAGVVGQAGVAGGVVAGSTSAGTVSAVTTPAGRSAPPIVAPSGDVPEPLPSGPTRTSNTGSSDDGDFGTSEDNGGNGGGNGGNGNADDNGGNGGGNGGGTGGGNLPGAQFVRSHQGDIVDAAIAWSDARNSGDGQRTLALGCSDDVAAVQAGQPNPAAYAGYSAIRPTGEVNPHASGLAAYVFISRQDLHTGATTPGTMPVVYENGSWHVCWYPGANTNRIVSGG